MTTLLEELLQRREEVMRRPGFKSVGIPDNDEQSNDRRLYHELNAAIHGIESRAMEAALRGHKEAGYD